MSFKRLFTGIWIWGEWLSSFSSLVWFFFSIFYSWSCMRWVERHPVLLTRSYCQGRLRRESGCRTETQAVTPEWCLFWRNLLIKSWQPIGIRYRFPIGSFSRHRTCESGPTLFLDLLQQSGCVLTSQDFYIDEASFLPKSWKACLYWLTSCPLSERHAKSSV